MTKFMVLMYNMDSETMCRTIKVVKYDSDEEDKHSRHQYQFPTFCKVRDMVGNLVAKNGSDYSLSKTLKLKKNL